MALAALALVVVVGCGGGSSSATASPGGVAGPSGAVGPSEAPAQAGGTTAVSAPTPVVTFPSSPVPGNSQVAPLPTDAPPTVTHAAPLPSCGGELLFEADPDISPLPTPPWKTTETSANRQGASCLIWAWENGKPAQLAISVITDEQDEVYTLYRLPGDGTVDVLTRVKSKPDQAVSWTDVTCKQLSIQEDQVTPADCSPETPLN